jgi:hypothetical protein
VVIDYLFLKPLYRLSIRIRLYGGRKVHEFYSIPLFIEEGVSQLGESDMDSRIFKNKDDFFGIAQQDVLKKT